MEVIRYVGGPVDANCYVVTFNKKAIIIDPCVKLDIIKKLIGEKELALVIVTHGHFDHICCLQEIEDYYNVPIYLAKQAIEKLENADHNLSSLMGCGFSININKDLYHIVNDYEKIDIEGNEILFIHTKGHSDCSICIKINNYLFTGDTLFKGSVGRCDLYTGNEKALRDTLKNLKIFFKNKCNTDTIIYPGHEDETTVEEELCHNYYLLDR